MVECNYSVSWWEGEYEGNCVLPLDHEPEDIHYDGMSWYNDDREEVDPGTTLLRIMREGWTNAHQV